MLSFAHVAIKAKKVKRFRIAKRITVTDAEVCSSVKIANCNLYSCPPTSTSLTITTTIVIVDQLQTKRKIPKNLNFCKHETFLPKTKDGFPIRKSFSFVLNKRVSIYLTVSRRFSSNYSWMASTIQALAPSFDYLLCAKWPKSECLHQPEYRIRVLVYPCSGNVRRCRHRLPCHCHPHTLGDSK